MFSSTKPKHPLKPFKLVSKLEQKTWLCLTHFEDISSHWQPFQVIWDIYCHQSCHLQPFQTIYSHVQPFSAIPAIYSHFHPYSAIPAIFSDFQHFSVISSHSILSSHFQEVPAVSAISSNFKPHINGQKRTEKDRNIQKQTDNIAVVTH